MSFSTCLTCEHWVHEYKGAGACVARKIGFVKVKTIDDGVLLDRTCPMTMVVVVDDIATPIIPLSLTRHDFGCTMHEVRQ